MEFKLPESNLRCNVRIFSVIFSVYYLCSGGYVTKPCHLYICMDRTGEELFAIFYNLNYI